MTMAHIDTVAPTDAAGDVQAMYARQQRHWGYVPNYAKVFCHRPEIMQYWADLQAAIRRRIEPRRFELVTFAAAHALRNSACTLAHGVALSEFISADEIRAIATGGQMRELSDAETSIVAFARQVAIDAAAVTRQDIERLHAVGVSDAEVFDIVAVAAARAFFAKLLDGLGVQPDSPMRDAAAALCDVLLVGRPIDTAPVERVADNPCDRVTGHGGCVAANAAARMQRCAPASTCQTTT
jgi:uncharacterized peroxidase-related enzyme